MQRLPTIIVIALFSCLFSAPGCVATQFDWVAQGKKLSEKNRFFDAIQCFNKALEGNPRDAASYCYRGHAFCCLNQLQRGMADFNRAVDLDPKCADAYLYRGRIYDGQSEFKLGAFNYEHYIQLRPNDSNAMYSLAENFAELGETEKALKYVNQSLKLNPNYWHAHMLRGNLSNKMGGHPETAVEDFSFVIRAKPEGYTRFYVLRASAYEHLGKFNNAIEDLSTVIKLNPEDEDIYNSRAAIFQKSGQYKKAIEDCTMAIKLDAEFAGASYYQRGLCYQKLGEQALAKKDFEMAAKIGYHPK